MASPKMHEQYEANAQRKSQVGQHGSHDSFLSFRFWFRRRQLERKPPKNRSKSMKIHARSSKNRRKINLGPSWAPTAVSGTRPDALGTVCRSPNDGPRPILGRPGRATDSRETSKTVPGILPRRLRTVPEPGLSMFGAKNTVECACGAIF